MSEGLTSNIFPLIDSSEGWTSKAEPFAENRFIGGGQGIYKMVFLKDAEKYYHEEERKIA